MTPTTTPKIIMKKASLIQTIIVWMILQLRRVLKALSSPPLLVVQHISRRRLMSNDSQKKERIRWSKQSNSALLPIGVPITSCGLSHTALFKTGLNERD